MRPLPRISVLLLACSLVALPMTTADAAQSKSSSSLAAARKRVDEAKKAANAAAARYNKARSAYERLGDDVVRLARNLEETETHMVALQAATAKRAVAAYKGHGGGVVDEFDSENAMEAARRTSFLAKVNAEDTDTFDELSVTATDLRERKDLLASRRNSQKEALQRLSAEQKQLQAKLDSAARAQRALEQALNAQRGSRGAAGGGAVIVNPGGGPFVCPIRGPVAFSNDWGNPRSGGRRHQGTDLMSPKGTPNVAVVSGSVTARSGGLGGVAIWLRGDNGTTYYYAHLDSISASGRVSQGQVIGTTGNTGNARGGPYHTHFEIHPGGGGAINPYPTIRAYC